MDPQDKQSANPPPSSQPEQLSPEEPTHDPKAEIRVQMGKEHTTTDIAKLVEVLKEEKEKLSKD